MTKIIKKIKEFVNKRKEEKKEKRMELKSILLKYVIN